MPNSYFQFKQFTIHQNRCAMKVTTDACLFGAWVAERVRSPKLEARGQKSEVKSEKSNHKTILDIGAGTGLLSLMLAQADNNLLIDAIEIDNDAFEQAQENIAAAPWTGAINILQGNAKEFVFTKQYDAIISNPPFYENELKSGSSKKNKAHHDEGLVLNDLLAIIKQNLKPEAVFYLLLPYKRNEAIENACAQNELVISHKTWVRQSTQHDYFRIMLSGKHQSNKKENFATTEIALKNEAQEYSAEFIKLLKDYYLHL